MGLSEKAKMAQRAYIKSYRDKNRESINKKLREWRKAHPEKVKEYQERYFSKLADELGLVADD